MQIDELLAKYADWLAWLREKQAGFEAQQARMEKKRKAAGAPAASPAASGEDETSLLFNIAFGGGQTQPAAPPAPVPGESALAEPELPPAAEEVLPPAEIDVETPETSQVETTPTETEDSLV